MNKENVAVDRALTWVHEVARPRTWRSYVSAMDYALAVSLGYGKWQKLS